MTTLIAQSPAEGLTPVDAAGTTLIELPMTRITSIAPYKGAASAVSKALKPLGLSFPSPGRSVTKGEARIVWTGPDQAFLIGPDAPPLPGAALTDQSDGWALFRLEGALAEAALARLVPVDLRAASFGIGATARTLLFHVPLSITRTGAQAFDLMVFRSMAATAVHDLSIALASVAAQAR